jgi:predicted transcriptional regulator
VEVRLSAEQEDRLRQIAARTGKIAEQVVQDAVDRHLEYEADFIDAVEKGLASARRGDLVEHDEVVARIDQILRS